MQENRQVVFLSLFPEAKPYRISQLNQAFFVPTIRSWEKVTTLSKADRERMEQSVPFLTVTQTSLTHSPSQDTYKALLTLCDGTQIETVLMHNTRGHWTICVSTQVGCAMKCSFCATGTMGFGRNVSSDEIIDQIRYWQWFLYDKNPDEQITNIVYMGMGEPLANYQAVKESLQTILNYIPIGPTHITVSTIGILPTMEVLLTDQEWPNVRIAISLHSADPVVRKKIVPTTVDDFHNKLTDWCLRYLEQLGNRSHYLTFEYVLLEGVNDSLEQAHLLGSFIQSIGHSKVNVIPWNHVIGTPFSPTRLEQIEAFKQVLREYQVVVTERRSRGSDIEAACGQLVVNVETQNIVPTTLMQ